MRTNFTEANARLKFLRALQAQRTAYGRTLPGRIAEIIHLWNMVLESTGDRLDDLARIRMLAHSLSGSAQVFGFGEVGDAARVLEQRADALPGAVDAPAISAAVHALGETIHRKETVQ